MRWTETRHGAARVLALSGRLDASSAAAFQEAVLSRLEPGADAGARLVLDLSGVDYISSAGLRVLMMASKRSRANGIALAVAGVQPVVAEILQISRFDTLFPCHATLAAALAEPGPSPAASSHAPAAESGSGAGGIGVRFWGTRGSLPAPLDHAAVQRKLRQALVAASGRRFETEDQAQAFLQALPFHQQGTFGGNSSCVELEADGDAFVLLDLGSGARLAGREALRRLSGRPGEFHVFMSHPHWDHIMGFPFFGPAYMPGQRIIIYGCHEVLPEAFRRQQSEPCFPVGFEQLGADIEFVVLEPGSSYDIAGYRVRPQAQLHGGDSYGYRFERDGRAVVYSTDAEHKPGDLDDQQTFIELFRDADLVIFDAMYSLAESVSVREDWGHSSNVMGVELCQLAGARRLALFHHEPVNDDETIERLWRESQRLEEITRRGARLEIVAAYDGLELRV